MERESPKPTGKALDDGIRAKCEASFGTTLSNVRVHEDGVAEQLGVRAVARGRDIHFARGCYDPSSASGQHVIAHELAHVVQQGALASPDTSALEMNRVASLEDEAEQAAHAALSGTKAQLSRGAVGISFQGWPDRDSPEDPLRTIARELEATKAKKAAETAPSGADDAVRGKAPNSTNVPIDKENPSGNPYVDHGALCDANDGTSSSCFLTKDQRSRLIQQLVGRVIVAETNCKLAASELRVDELVAKDDDGDWVTMLLLDLVIGYVGGRVAASFARMRSDEATLEAIVASAGANPSRLKRMQASGAAAFKKLSPEHLTDGVEKAVDMAKDKTEGAAKNGAETDATSKKAAKISLTERFTNEIASGFTNIRELAPATANDLELVALFRSFDAAEHSPAQYKEALAAKVERHRHSGVTMIGHLPQMAQPDGFRDLGPNFYQEGREHVESDGKGGTRDERGVYVIWHAYKSGAPKRLVFQCNGVPRNLATRHGRIAGHNLPDGDPDRDSAGYVAPHFVPEEFISEAIARHKRAWNDEPGIELVDDTAWRQAMPPDIRPKSKSSSPAVSSPVPATVSKPLMQPDQSSANAGFMLNPLAKFPKA